MGYRMSIKEAEDYLNGIPKFSKKTTMENERRILALLGNPERGQQFVHVAGTNGKGSVCAFLSRILREQGFRVGTFTSPHLVDITERFLADGEQVSEEEFLDAFHCVYSLCMEKEGEIVHPSYFEFLFLIGLLIFKKCGADITVIETGLGGRLDATNVIEAPKVCVITSISLDHTEILGETIAQIAGEKAGIIKDGCPVVYDGSSAEASAVVRAAAGKRSAPTYPVLPSDFAVTERSQTGISFQMMAGPLAGQEFRVPFVADYQAMNAALAVTAAWVLRERADVAESGRKPEIVEGQAGCGQKAGTGNGCGLAGTGESRCSHGLVEGQAGCGRKLGTGDGCGLAETEENIRSCRLAGVRGRMWLDGVKRALLHTSWPGRMESVLPGIYMDGAHNDDGIRVFAEAAMKIPGAGKRYLLFSAVVEKDYRAMVDEICRLADFDGFILTELDSYRALPLADIRKAFEGRTDKPVWSFGGIGEAFAFAREKKGSDGLLFIAGSLYLAGSIKALLREEWQEKGIEKE